MAAGHGLTHVQEQAVSAVGGDVYLALEDVADTHLAPSALGGGDVHCLLLACLVGLGQADGLIGGVKIRETVVVPEQTIAAGAEVHGNGNLRVDLGEAAGEAAQVAVAVLELSEAEQHFVAG